MFKFKSKKKKATKPLLKGFVKLTRVYGKKDDNVKTQPIMVAVNEIETFRPRNKVGTQTNRNRCTIITTSGKYINVTEKFSEVQELLAQSVL